MNGIGSQLPSPPSPLHFIGAVLYGIFMGLLPGLFVLVSLHLSFSEAIAIFAILAVFAALYHAMGWLLVFAPFYTLRWIWRKLSGYVPVHEPETQRPGPQHWTLIAGFWSGVALTCLLFLYSYMNR